MNKKIIIISLALIIGLGVAFVSFAKAPVSFFKRVDFVNIGSPASEASHNLQGWGPIEPATNGGNWGNIANETSCGLVSPQKCDKALRVTYASDEPDHPVINGRMATVKFNLKKQGWGLIKGLRIRALDGIANDDFMVFIKGKRGQWHHVYTYISDPSTAEVWKIHTIKLGPKFWRPTLLCPNHITCPNCDRSVEVAIMATGDTWGSHSTYGQLGIDWIELVGWKGVKPPVSIHPLDL